ncbi:MAG TPA: copper resistance protein CopC [Caulobacteraceae bacterium]|nr:copper resistance protein CopC [Caulobacteraceae bacterium]
MTSLALALAFSPAAGAHAFLQRAEPRVGSTLAAPPARIVLHFTEALEASLCAVTVTGPAGFGGAAGAQPVAGDPRALAVVPRKPLPAGRYLVRWRVVSVDSHTTQGDFSFDVAP